MKKKKTPKGWQTHHISYKPEITIDIPTKLHKFIHGHGTGKPTGDKRVPGEFWLGCSLFFSGLLIHILLHLT